MVAVAVTTLNMLSKPMTFIKDRKFQKMQSDQHPWISTLQMTAMKSR